MKALSFLFSFVALALGLSSAPADNLFVTINVENSILEYNTAVGASSRSIFATNITGTSFFGLAIDTNGNVFASVLNSGSGYGFIYKWTPAGSPSTWAAGLDPNCLVFDPGGNLYAPGFTFAGTPAIYEFMPGQNRSNFYTTSHGLGAFYGAFDSGTNLFIANGSFGNILKFTPGGTPSMFAGGFSLPTCLAFDTNGNLFMGDGTAGVIYKFSNIGGTLSSAAVPFASGFNLPRGLAFDSAGNLFMADQNAYLIYEFTNSGGVLSSTPIIFDDLTASGDNPEHLAFGPSPPPALSIASSGPEGVLVSWPSPSTGFVLQQNSSLTPSGWGNPTNSVNDDGIHKSVLISPAAGAWYFRLKK